MRIYCLKYDGSDLPLLPFLSEQRLKRRENARCEAVKRQTSFSYALLRLALFIEYGIAFAPEFVYGEHGKPFIKELPSVFFNISHSDGFALCAVSDKPIGADIQNIRPLSLRSGEKFCTPQELKTAESSENISEKLCRIWCIKESYGKLTGKGFAEGFTGFSAEELIKSGKAYCLKHGNVYISVCSEEEDEFPPVADISEEELISGLCSLELIIRR